MKAMLFGINGEPELGEIPEPVPGDGEVKISVHTASVNRADVIQRRDREGGDRSSPAQVVGLDAAGEVVEVGSGVTGVEPGQRVMTLAPTGGLAERISVDARGVIPLPRAWTYEQGAAAVLGLLTEHDALVTRARLQAGESVVIHAAASGVGIEALQLARYYRADPIIGTIRSLDRAPALRELGATHVVDATKDWPTAVLDATNGNGADVIIDHVGGPYLEGNIKSMALKGRLVSVGRLGGAVGQLDMEVLAIKRLDLIGVTFRTRTPAEKREVVSAARRDLSAALDEGALTPKIDRVLPWTEAAAAQDLMASNAQFGKLVLTVLGP